MDDVCSLFVLVVIFFLVIRVVVLRKVDMECWVFGVILIR